MFSKMNANLSGTGPGAFKNEKEIFMGIS